jgi:hypothetical protein
LTNYIALTKLFLLWMGRIKEHEGWTDLLTAHAQTEVI